MKTTIIPAQITTVEDKIIGSLNLSQVLLLINPIILAIITYLILPPFSKLSLIKLIVISIYSVVNLSLAFKIKEKILLDWVLILVTYFLRPRYFIYDKNEAFGRPYEVIEINNLPNKKNLVNQISTEQISNSISFFERVLIKSNFKLKFKPSKKGGIHVTLYKV